MMRLALVVVAGLLVASADCGAPTAPTFTQLRDEVFVPRCGNAAGCHADNPARGFDLKVDPYSAMVGVASVADPTKQYVVAGDPENSLLLTILKGPIDVGDEALNAEQMPPGFALPADIVADIEAWIAAGAPND